MLNPFKEAFFPVLRFFGKRKMQRVFSEEPILIGGCGRSGTTLLLSVLSAHPAVYAIPNELSVFNYWTKRKYKEPLRIDRLYREVLFSHIPKQATRFCEKTPRNVRHIPEIMNFFDGHVKFIHIVRDGRDVILSQHPDKKNEYWIKPERWIKDVSAGLAYAEHENVLTIKYEDLVEDYSSTINQICSFLNLEMTEELLNWLEHTKVRDNQAWHNGVSSLHSRSIGKWKQRQNEGIIKSAMANEEFAELLEKLGYINR